MIHFFNHTFILTQNPLIYCITTLLPPTLNTKHSPLPLGPFRPFRHVSPLPIKHSPLKSKTPRGIISERFGYCGIMSDYSAKPRRRSNAAASGLWPRNFSKSTVGSSVSPDSMMYFLKLAAVFLSKIPFCMNNSQASASST